MQTLLAARMVEAEKTTLAIDIGTNTEICLNHRGRKTSVSCASGPGFEDAHIKSGMRAAPGAIEHVRLAGERLEIQTIGGETPVGSCDLGLLDVVAQLRSNNVLDRSGRMSPGAHSLVHNQNGTVEFVLVERDGRQPSTISPKDVRELQLANAAIRLGIQALVNAEGITENDIDGSLQRQPICESWLHTESRQVPHAIIHERYPENQGLAWKSFSPQNFISPHLDRNLSLVRA